MNGVRRGCQLHRRILPLVAGAIAISGLARAQAHALLVHRGTMQVSLETVTVRVYLHAAELHHVTKEFAPADSGVMSQALRAAAGQYLHELGTQLCLRDACGAPLDATGLTVTLLDGSPLAAELPGALGRVDIRFALSPQNGLLVLQFAPDAPGPRAIALDVRAEAQPPTRVVQLMAGGAPEFLELDIEDGARRVRSMPVVVAGTPFDLRGPHRYRTVLAEWPADSDPFRVRFLVPLPVIQELDAPAWADRQQLSDSEVAACRRRLTDRLAATVSLKARGKPLHPERIAVRFRTPASCAAPVSDPVNAWTGWAEATMDFSRPVDAADLSLELAGSEPLTAAVVLLVRNGETPAEYAGRDVSRAHPLVLDATATATATATACAAPADLQP